MKTNLILTPDEDKPIRVTGDNFSQAACNLIDECRSRYGSECLTPEFIAALSATGGFYRQGKDGEFREWDMSSPENAFNLKIVLWV